MIFKVIEIFYFSEMKLTSFVSEYTNMFFITLFAMEMLLKMYSLGFQVSRVTSILLRTPNTDTFFEKKNCYIRVITAVNNSLLMLIYRT